MQPYTSYNQAPPPRNNGYITTNLVNGTIVSSTSMSNVPPPPSMGMDYKRPLDVRNPNSPNKKRRRYSTAAERRAQRLKEKAALPAFTVNEMSQRRDSFISGGLENTEAEVAEEKGNPMVAEHKKKATLLRPQNTWGLRKMYGIGFKLMSKAGWDGKSSLGKEGQGIATPIISINKNDKKGIRTHFEQKRLPGGVSKKKAAERRRLERRKQEKLHGMAKGALTPGNDGTLGQKDQSAPGMGSLRTRAKKRAKWRQRLERRLGLPRNSLSCLEAHGGIKGYSRHLVNNLELQHGISQGVLWREIQQYKNHIEALRNQSNGNSPLNGRTRMQSHDTRPHGRNARKTVLARADRQQRQQQSSDGWSAPDYHQSPGRYRHNDMQSYSTTQPNSYYPPSNQYQPGNPPAPVHYPGHYHQGPGMAHQRQQHPNGYGPQNAYTTTHVHPNSYY